VVQILIGCGCIGVSSGTTCISMSKVNRRFAYTPTFLSILFVPWIRGSVLPSWEPRRSIVDRSLVNVHRSIHRSLAKFRGTNTLGNGTDPCFKRPGSMRSTQLQARCSSRICLYCASYSCWLLLVSGRVSSFVLPLFELSSAPSS
jgi:hypothetical protein